MLGLVVAKICLPSIWDHRSRLRKCLVVGNGPCSASWSSFGGAGPAGGLGMASRLFACKHICR